MWPGDGVGLADLHIVTEIVLEWLRVLDTFISRVYFIILFF